VKRPSVLVDSHCHLDRLDLSQFGGELDQALDLARAEGVRHFLCVGINLEDWAAMLRLIEPFADVWASVGVHPADTDTRIPESAELVRHAAHPRVVALGETGLDYHYGGGYKRAQQLAFRRHIVAARDTDLPLIVHTREAREDTLGILREEGAEAVGGVLHCFTETWDMARAALDMGFYISFSGIVTFRTADDLRDVARRVPADRLLVETDSPYLSPVPYRGKSNHPARVRQVAECVAAVRGEPVDRLAAQTTENFLALFGRHLAAQDKTEWLKSLSPPASIF
jgi:TatD DNase family protein